MVFFPNTVDRTRIYGNSFTPGQPTNFQYTANIPPMAIGPGNLGHVANQVMYTAHGPPRAMGPAHVLGQEPKSAFEEVLPFLAIPIFVTAFWFITRQR